MNTSNPGQPISRDQVLVAHAVEMIARTAFSQDDFAQSLSANLHLLIPAKAVGKDVPNVGSLTHGDGFLKTSGTWLRRVNRWLTSEVDLPCWIEEAWVQSLTGEFQECCLNELASRHGLTGARELDSDGNALGEFGQLVVKLGLTVQLGSEILSDGRIDADDLANLPDFVDRLRAVEARCSGLRSHAEDVLEQQTTSATMPTLHQVNSHP